MMPVSSPKGPVELSVNPLYVYPSIQTELFVTNGLADVPEPVPELKLPGIAPKNVSTPRL
jgi:hypothetical protein